MLRRILILALAAGCVAALAWWVRSVNNRPPEVPFAKAGRQTLVSSVTTNGKVEPYRWMAVRTERDGLVQTVSVQRGQPVAEGAVIAHLDAGDAEAQLASANAQIAQAQAQLQILRQGGAPAERTEIDNQLARARLDLQVAQRNYASLERLAKKQAATQQEVFDARQQVDILKQQIDALQKKRAALVSPADTSAAEARLRQGMASAQAAQQILRQSTLRAPMAGVVYELDVRPGAYLAAGEQAAKVGVLNRLRVIVYVDEPELGRVAVGMPVTITWDALPGREWKGTVERVPTEVVAQGTRQVGEVAVVIENPGRELLPGTNVNAAIQSQVAPNALVIPKAAVRRQGTQDGVFALRDDHVAWAPVKLGAASVNSVQVLSGINEGDAVALSTEEELHDGEQVRPVYR